MHSVIKLTNVSFRWTITNFNISLRHIRMSLAARKSQEKTKESEPAFNIFDELREPELTEDEILRKRFKARLPERLYRIFVNKEALPIDNEYDLKLFRLRAYYGRHGKESKLNPGLCWPTREEILETIEYDKVFEPPLQERIKNVETARLAEEQRKRDVEAEVDKNMATLDKAIADYHAKIAKKSEEVLEKKRSTERKIEEVCEYLGYDLDPRDPRFQEAFEQMEKERKKALKVKKQQESYEKMLAKLKDIATKK